MSWGAFILAPEGPRLGPDEARFFSQARPFGFILFTRNAETPDQVRRLTGDLRDAVGYDAPIFIDQEGGRVARLEPPHWRAWTPPLDEVTRLGGGAERALALRYRIIASELRAVGIDGNCAPLADLARDDTHPVLLNRCYGRRVDEVVSRARAVADALLAGGTLPVLKHIPGHGRAVSDSHEELPRVDADPGDLRQSDFAAFQRLAGIPIGMTAHVVYAAFDDEPATTSSAMIRLIRNEIGFDGLLMSDDISMNALRGTIHERAQASVAAGCDLVLHCSGDRAEMEAVAALGQMTPEAAERAHTALSFRAEPDTVDIDALAEEFAALTRGAV